MTKFKAKVVWLSNASFVGNCLRWWIWDSAAKNEFNEKSSYRNFTPNQVFACFRGENTQANCSQVNDSWSEINHNETLPFRNFQYVCSVHSVNILSHSQRNKHKDIFFIKSLTTKNKSDNVHYKYGPTLRNSIIATSVYFWNIQLVLRINIH